MSATLISGASVSPVLTDFTADTADLGWFVLNDNVMGGRSEGGFTVTDDRLRFSGRTNTNGGGFSSIRSAPLTLNLSEREGIEIRVRGDGRRYTWRLSTDARYRGRELGYWAKFDTTNGEWQTIRIPFAQFAPRFRGQPLTGPALEPSQIRGMGLMVYDGLDGVFEIELASVGTYVAPFSLEEFHWKKRVVVLSGPYADDERVRGQLSKANASRAESDERDIVWVTLFDKGVSQASSRPLSLAEIREVRHKLDLQPGEFSIVLVGKDGSIKLRRSAIAEMSELHDLIDTMPMRRNEMAGSDKRRR
ncbi:MAG: CIA30 family protein [Myxococcota bacterium]